MINASDMKRTAWKAFVLSIFGAVAYSAVEIAWRGYTYYSMAVLGGFLFVLIGGLNEFLPWDMSIILQGLIGSVVVTIAELLVGIILNMCLGLHVWDYSNMPFNFLGQICPQFSLAWFGLSIVAIILDDFLRHWIFGEEYPRYHLF